MENTLTIAQLVSKWNQLVLQAESVGLTRYKPINSKFKDAQTGMRRIEELESSIRAALASERAVETQQENEDMARQKKSKQTRQKAASARTRAPRGNGADSIQAKTDEFNSLVKSKKKDQAPWARHHSSLFGSHDAADKMLKKLRSELG